jgi:hypothetical protein
VPAKAFKTGVDVLRTFESFSSSVWADESIGKKPKALKNKKALEKSSARGKKNEEWTEEQEKWNEEEKEEEWKDDGNWEEEEEWKEDGNWEEDVDMNAVYENEDNFEAEKRGSAVRRPGVDSSRQNNRIVEQFMPRYIFCIFFGGLECWPLLCFCRPFCIFGKCLNSNPESCRSKQVPYQLSHPSSCQLSNPSPYKLSHLSPCKLSRPSPYQLSHPSPC